MAMIPRDRLPYRAIVDRPKLRLPNGERIIVWTIVNLEVWDISRSMARQALPPPTGVTTLPDVPNWSWHEYGMRGGVDYPRVAQACKDSGWEFMGHSYEQGPIHNEKDQPAMIKRALDTIERFTGKRAVGWLGPGLNESL